MKFTPAMRKETNAALRRAVYGAHHFELVERFPICVHPAHDKGTHLATYNMLAFAGCETDLWGSTPVSQVRDIGDPVDGRFVIDVYVYRSLGFGEGTELWDTATVVIDGSSITAHARYYGDVVAAMV